MKLGIVDPLISDDYVAQRLNDCQIAYVAIYTEHCAKLTKFEKQKRMHPELFQECIFINSNDSNDMELLKVHGITHVIYGSEYSVEIADKIANAINAKGNKMHTSGKRYDKFQMLSAISDSELGGYKQVKITKAMNQDVLQKLIANTSFPVFMKPINAGAGYAGKACTSSEELMNHIAMCYENTNTYNGVDISEFTIQELLDGNEYFVDAVSFDGEFLPISLFQYKHILLKDCKKFQYFKLLLPTVPEYKILTEYVMKVLQILNFDFGFSHTEVFLTKFGPKLIEVNPRVSGAHGLANYITKMCSGYDQIGGLHELSQRRNSTYYNVDRNFNKHGALFFVQNFEENKIFNGLNEEFIKRLSSYDKYVINTKIGERLSLIQVHHAVAFIVLLNEDETELMKDIDLLIVNQYLLIV